MFPFYPPARASSKSFCLHKAAAKGQEEEVRSYLEHMLVDVRDHNLFTPLHHAARAGEIGIMIILLWNGADKHAANKNHNTPLHSAAYGDKPEAIQYLLAHGANKYRKNKDGDTPLHSAAWKGCVASVEALADASCIDEPNNEGDTPLHLAAWNNQFAVVRRLVESGATVLSFNKDGHTPADLAMEKGHTAIKEFLDEQVPGVGLSLSC